MRRARGAASLGALTALIYLLGAQPVAGQIIFADVEAGRELFVEGCASCHGPEGAGSDVAPSLVDVGAASADFQLRTGRMPLADVGGQTRRKDPAYDSPAIEQLVAYIATLGDGPEIPEVAPAGTNLAAGQLLFIENCAACHGATAAGGAVGNNAFAPGLFAAEPLDVAEAMIVGPGEMPKFAFSDEERNEVVGFVQFLQEQPHPGGVDIGGIGPVPEGFVAWLGGMGLLVVLVLLIGRTGRRPEEDN